MPHLQVQDLASGEVKDLLPLNADSQEPAMGNAGLVGFTYYKFNARGDICYLKLQVPPQKNLDEHSIHCLKRAVAQIRTEASSPFWKSSDELAYVERDIESQERQIVAENINTGRRQVLAQGRLWSPAMRINGQYLVYVEMVDQAEGGSTRHLVFKNLSGSVHKKCAIFITRNSGLSGHFGR